MAEVAQKIEAVVAANNRFVGICPQCEKEGLFTPETLYRWCVATSDKEDYVSEPAKHLTRVEALDRNSFDPDLGERVHVLFASTCPQPNCHKPIFLRVAGPKIEFVKIIRQRQGRPNGQTEEDLRLRELELVSTLPKMPAANPGLKWICSTELGPLCETLNRLAPDLIGKRDSLDVVGSSRDLFYRLLIKLEGRAEICRQIEWLHRKSSWGAFGFILEIRRMFRNELIYKSVRQKYLRERSGKSSYDVNRLIDNLAYSYFDADRTRESVEGELRKRLSDRRSGPAPSIPQRLKALYERGWIDRCMWRWSERLFQEASANKEEFFADSRKDELAAFVRILADDAFEQPDEILATMNDRKERGFKQGGRVPTK